MINSTLSLIKKTLFDDHKREVVQMTDAEKYHVLPVFVYGSLLTGLMNNRLMQDDSHFTYGGPYLTNPRFLMVSMGAFPGVKSMGNIPSTTVSPPHSDAPVLGELWWCDTEGLSRLDRLEGHPEFYKRETTFVSPMPPLTKTDEVGLSFSKKEKQIAAWNARQGKVYIYELPTSYFLGSNKRELLQPNITLSQRRTQGLSWRHFVSNVDAA